MYQAYAGELLNQKERETAEVSAAPTLDTAARRLNAALDRLEEGLAASGKLAPYALAGDAEEQASLRRERAKLNTAIAQLQDQYDDMHRSAAHISDKLGETIKRLTGIVG